MKRHFLGLPPKARQAIIDEKQRQFQEILALRLDGLGAAADGPPALRQPRRQRAKARAVRRCGELLQPIEARGGDERIGEGADDFAQQGKQELARRAYLSEVPVISSPASPMSVKVGNISPQSLRASITQRLSRLLRKTLPFKRRGK
jgi:hypothetical protein